MEADDEKTKIYVIYPTPSEDLKLYFPIPQKLPVDNKKSYIFLNNLKHCEHIYKSINQSMKLFSIMGLHTTHSPTSTTTTNFGIKTWINEAAH